MSKLLFLTKAKTNRRIKLGETIKFLKEPELSESFNVKVTGLLRYESFKDMFKDFDISILAD